MKKLLLALIVMASLASCGKNNSVDSSAASSTSAISVATLPPASQALATQLGAMVNANQFGLGQATYYESYAQYVSHAPNTTYSYGTLATTGSSNPNCKTVGYIFTYCTSASTTTTSSATITRSVIHSSVNVAAQQSALIAIINKTNQIAQVGQGVYEILTTDNITYFIDTRYPIQANPTQTQQANGTGETLVKIQ